VLLYQNILHLLCGIIYGCDHSVWGLPIKESALIATPSFSHSDNHHFFPDQNDDFLIFPGDLAFEIGCRYKDEVPEASIGLADPDPAAKEMPKHKKSTVTSKTGFVQFFPDDIRPRKKPSKKVKTESGKKVVVEKKKSKKEGKKNKSKTQKKKTAAKTEL
jgi:hypothetical protein